MEKSGGGLDVALVHYPVCNKNGETIGSAVTNLDVHDIARACRTFGADAFYLLTPFEDQRRIVGEILQHWRQGYGALYNPKRKEALELVEVVSDLEELYQTVQGRRKEGFRILATGAVYKEGSVEYATIRRQLAEGENFLLLFGTGWGLTSEVLQTVDDWLPAIRGRSDYNHLSVRSAAAIVLDRLRGRTY
jgi:tRNA (guanine37-N1)-methyltransferase